ncbi:MAG: hypothetical protein HQL21_09845 [Candidatus Omnitrophica bacterium]|nr:hypothetical protein [Candidatus Omnitrophota bacterium]
MRRRVTDLKEGYRQNLAILGSLNVGKSTVLQRFLLDMDDSLIIPVYLDLENRDVHYFSSKMLRSILYHFCMIKGLPTCDELPSLLETVKPVLPLTFERAVALNALIEKGKFADAYQGLIEFPEIFTQETGLFCVLIFDEFQTMEEFGIPDVFRRLADRITTQKNCLYILASSYEEQARKILSEKLTLLFGNFELVTIEPFDLRASQGFIVSRMGEVKMGVQLRNFLADFTGGRPLYLDIIVQELINLSAIYKQQEIYTPLVVQAIENMVFSRWGALSRHFDLVLNRLCVGKTNRLVMDLIIALVNGTHKVKDLVKILGAKQNPIIQRLNYLVDEDIVERNGSHFHIKDKLMRYWVKYVFERRIRSIEMEPGRLKKEFKDELTRSVGEFQVVCRKDLVSRMTELMYCFDNEQFSLRGRSYKLPVFRDIKLLKMRQRGGHLIDVLHAETDEGVWLVVLRKEPVMESDISALGEEARKMGLKIRPFRSACGSGMSQS